MSIVSPAPSPLPDVEIDIEKLAFAIELRRGTKSLRDAAKEITGVGFTTLHAIQVGKQNPDTLTLLRLCRWLDKPVEYFVREVAA
jgi:DNA-binding XRE family transcriptional regulator